MTLKDQCSGSFGTPSLSRTHVIHTIRPLQLRVRTWTDATQGVRIAAHGQMGKIEQSLYCTFGDVSDMLRFGCRSTLLELQTTIGQGQTELRSTCSSASSSHCDPLCISHRWFQIKSDKEFSTTGVILGVKSIQSTLNTSEQRFLNPSVSKRAFAPITIYCTYNIVAWKPKRLLINLSRL